MVIGDLREGDLLIRLSALLVIFILVLAKLAASVGAKTVEMTRVCQGHGVGFTARNGNDLFVAQCLHSCWVRLVRLILCVFGQVTNIIETKLAKSCLTPGIDIAFFG